MHSKTFIGKNKFINQNVGKSIFTCKKKFTNKQNNKWLRRGQGCNKTYHKGRNQKICNSSSKTWQLESYIYEGVGIRFLQKCKINSFKRAHPFTSAHDPLYAKLGKDC